MPRPTALNRPKDGPLLPLPVRWQCDLADDRLTWALGVFDLFGMDRAVRPVRGDVLARYLPESRDALEQLRADAIRLGQSFVLDTRIVRPDGDIRWMRITADVLIRDGRITHLYGQKQDRTDAFATDGA
ncbi:PAS domain-containing protein [Sphingomonas sp. FW199]|uniref:PAS domain-containing protein n=1 Tax=Sphingomonas sp. FW199 TaxID=3400217 RepID=UPI003CF8267F